MKKNILLFIIALITFPLLSIEVGGHITENTLWYPHHNDPYVVTSFLYIDSGVTLTILPGTQIYVSGGVISDSHHFEWGGLNNDQEPVAKKIVVNGTINAIGTPQNPIIFDKYQEDSDYRWGGIYLTANAPISTFEYCEFNNGMLCDYAPNERAWATLEFGNGLINISDCSFSDNYIAFATGNLMMDLVVYNCSFYSDDVYPPPFISCIALVIGTSDENPPEEDYELVIARCYFTGTSDFVHMAGNQNVLFLFNNFDDFDARDEEDKSKDTNYASVSSYGNYAYNGKRGWGCSSGDSTDVVFARKNTLIKTEVDLDPLNLYSEGYGTNYVSDNYLLGYTQITATTREGNEAYIYNNIMETSYTGSSTVEFDRLNTSQPDGQIRFYNNLVRQTGGISTGKVFTSDNTSPYIYNNTFVNYSWLINAIGSSAAIFTNNIIDIQNSYGGNSGGYITSFFNNLATIPIIDYPSYYYTENHLVANPLFADTLSDDYSLSPLSPCRDAGAYRPDLPDFDIRYHKRIATANGSNPEVVDIGAYEFGSAYIGGIRGNVYDASTNEPLDCVKIEIMDKLPEFSDSLGNYTYHCGAGTYSVKASRWDYQDVIISDVMIMESLELNLDIPMLPIGVSNQDEEVIPASESAFGLRNYPNPFNPETKISFILPKKAYGHLSVYNLKGQKVASLYQGLLNSGYHNYVWDGKNSQSASVSSGIYFVKLEVEGKSQTHKIVLMK